MLPINRRTAIGGLLCAAPATFAPALAQSPVVMPAGPRLVPVDGEVAITLDAWTDSYGRPTALVRLNGQGPFSFLVDTGSTATVMSESVALVVGAARIGTLTIAGATGTATKPFTIIDTLQTGAVTRNNLRVAILPNADIKRGDGILGADVFAGKRLVFSIRDKIVRVEASKRPTHGSPDGNLRLRQGSLAEVDGRVGRVSAKLILDTGADYCIANPALGVALQRAHPRLTRTPDVRVTGVTGHRITGEFIALPRVDVRAFAVEDSAAVIADASIFRHWELESEPAMIVGADLLSRLESFSIDYGAKMFDAKLLSDLIARNSAAFG
jgi:hypothetical protein